MNALATIRLLAEREIRARLGSKAYVASTLILSVVLAALAFLPVLIGDDEPDADVATESLVIGVVDGLTDAAAAAIEASLPLVAYDITFEAFDERGPAEAAVRAGDVDLLVSRSMLVTATASDVFGRPPASAEPVAEALRVAFFVDRNGVDPRLAADITGAPTAPVRILDSVDESSTGARFLVANLGAVFLYGTLIMYGMWIVNGVIEEKSNRVVEMLLATVKPVHLMAGKIVGMGALGIGQVIVIFAPAAIIGVTQVEFLRDAGLGSAVAWIAVWWVLGYALYSVLLAGAAALVSRPEEAQVAATPVNVLLIVAYLVAVIGIEQPDGPVMQIASLVPFSAPLAMLLRQVVGEPAAWEVAASIGLIVVAIVGSTFVGARLYEGAILRVGSRVGWRQAWRNATD